MPATPNPKVTQPDVFHDTQYMAIPMEGSSSSSTIDLDVGPVSGILVSDVEQADPEIGDGDEGSAVGQFDNDAASESSRKQLREQLKRTLTKTKERERSAGQYNFSTRCPN